jgi:hypothetical protein
MHLPFSFGKSQFLLSLFIFLAFCFGSCQKDTKRSAPDVSNIKADVKIERFEKDLFALDTLNLAASLPILEKKYGTFASVFFEQITGLNEKAKPSDGTNVQFPSRVSGFINYKTTRKLYDTTQIAFKNLNDVETELSMLLRYYKYYFPKRTLPKFYSCVSEYSVGAFTVGDSIVGIGLDMFLGAKYPIYAFPPMNFPEYVTRTLDKNHLPVYVANALIDEIAPPAAGSRMLDVMLQNGKKIYVLASLLPATADSTLHCYTTKQMDWCHDNEAEMWSFFLDQKMLYSNDQKTFRRFTEAAPTSNGMPEQAPGRTANYIGYKIIEQYMAAHPNMPLQALLDERNAEKIFKESKYKPSK